MEDNNNEPVVKTKARPEQLPRPTYWPFFLALALTLMGWGLISAWLFSVTGLIIFAIALYGWINDLRNE